MGTSSLRRRRTRLTIALAGLGLCASLGLGLGAAWADQLPDLPPPPAPAGSDPGGDGSAGGYPNASENQAENLFTTEFSNTVTSLAADPADLGPDARYLNAHAALVAPGAKNPAEFKAAVEQILDQNEGDIDAARSELNDLVAQQNAGGSDLVSATLPLRTADDTGHQAPIDLSLDPQGTGYVPDNPLVDLKLPSNLTNEVAVGDQGIKVDVGATEAATADAISAGDSLFYHEAATDTDVVLAPLSVGFETLYQLRSPQSPEQLEMGFTLPAGASLEHSDGGGAQVVKDGDTLAMVSAPSATDAAGNEVQVTTSVSDDSLELHVSHQDENVAYPINVDPVTDVYTGSNGAIGAFSTDWAAGKTSGSAYQTGTTCVQNVSCTSGTTGPRGLYIHAPTNQTYSTGQAANWVYLVPHWAPSTAYITDLTLGPMDYDRHSGTSTNPYLAAGILSSSLTWVSSMTQSTNMANTYWTMDPPSNQTTGKVAVFQLYAGSTQSLTHWRHALLGGVQVGLSDTDYPTVNANTAPLTSGWTDGNQTTTLSVDATDGGLGVDRITGRGAYGSPDETVYLPSQANHCVGTHASLCPQSGSATFSHEPGDLPQGRSTEYAWAMDPLLHVTLPTWDIRVDGSPPQISTSGGLSQSASGDPYTLHVGATDGNTSSSTQWRSGVKEIEVDLNGQQVADRQQNCTAQAGSCPLSLDYTSDPSSFTTDQLHFTVIATDQLGHQQTKEWDVSVPDSSIDSGPSGLISNATPSFTYSSTVSGSSFQCRVDGGAFNACSASGYTASHLNDGEHTFDVRAANSAGQIDQTPASRVFTVDATSPQLTATGDLLDEANPLVGADPVVDADATDAGSGVTSVALLIEDQQAAQLVEDCPDGGCALTGTLQPDLSEQDPGQHSYEVVATDAAGNTSHQSGEFRLDPTPPQLEVTGTLADSNGQPLEASTADAQIAATDNASGDSGVAKIELTVDTTVDATDTVSCDPSCPALATTTYSYNKTDWAPGPHPVNIAATDAAGNVQHSLLLVDAPAPPPPVDCPQVTATVQDAVNTVTVAQAEESVIPPAVDPSESAYDPDTESEIDPSLAQPDDSPPTPLDATGSLTADEVGSAPAGGFNVDQVACLVPTQTTADETNATIVNGDSALYANSASDTDTIVRPTAGGETIIESAHGSAAPQSFSWKVSAAPGNQLEQLANGAVAIVDPSQVAPADVTVPDQPEAAQDPEAIPDAATQLAEQQYEVAAAQQETGNTVAAVITPPYTIDSQGNSAPTTLSVTGPDTITVDSANARATVLSVASGIVAPSAVDTFYGKVDNDICHVHTNHPTRPNGQAVAYGKNYCDYGFGVEYTEIFESLFKRKNGQWALKDQDYHYHAGAGSSHVQAEKACANREIHIWGAQAFSYTVIDGVPFSGANPRHGLKKVHLDCGA